MTIAQDGNQLKQLLATGLVDVVMSDLGQVTQIDPARPASGARATVIPVMLQGSKPELLACQASFNCQLKKSDRIEKYLTTVNSIIADRAKALKSPRGN